MDCLLLRTLREEIEDDLVYTEIASVIQVLSEKEGFDIDLNVDKICEAFVWDWAQRVTGISYHYFESLDDIRLGGDYAGPYPRLKDFINADI